MKKQVENLENYITDPSYEEKTDVFSTIFYHRQVWGLSCQNLWNDGKQKCV